MIIPDDSHGIGQSPSLSTKRSYCNLCSQKTPSAVSCAECQIDYFKRNNVGAWSGAQVTSPKLKCGTIVM